MCFETKQKGKIAKMSILNNKIVFENKMLYSLLKSIKKLKNKGRVPNRKQWCCTINERYIWQQ